MARVRVSSMTVHPSGVGSPQAFVEAAIKLAKANDGADVTLIIKGLPFKVTEHTDTQEAALKIESSTGLIRSEAISLYGNSFGREHDADIVESIHFKLD